VNEENTVERSELIQKISAPPVSTEGKDYWEAIRGLVLLVSRLMWFARCEELLVKK